jgi:signal transduction histidine kinase/ActR/RegA family two-component response regulator
MDASPGVARSTILRQSDESYENTRPENLSELSDNSELSENIERQNEAKWAARLVGAGSLLTLVYETAFLVLDRRFLSLSDPSVLIFHSVNIALFLLAVFMVARVGPWMRRHWKTVAFSFSSLMIVSSACIAVKTGENEPLALALILFLAGTGPFLCWGEKIQGLLSLIAISSFAVVSRILPARVDWYQWLGVLIGAAIGLFSTALERRQRRAKRRAEESLLKSREMLVAQERMRIAGQLAAGIAHDLNNTLNVIQLRFALVVQDEEVVAKHGVRLEAISRAIEDAAQTVARVRELGMRRVAGRSEVVQLAEIVGQAIDLTTTSIEGRYLINGKAIRIASCLQPGLPQVRGPASELRQVFLNLLLNASDAMPQGGTIRIDSEVERDTVTVRICDQGTGIAPQDLERIFEPFFTTKGPRGTGLGLSLARKVMETIGGSIAATNQPAGDGAVFTLKFPIARPLNSGIQSHEHATCSYRHLFLIVDDDAENLDALREVLISSGHSVDTARSGAEALEKLRLRSDYDVVLCDSNMPGANGWDVARQSSEFASTPEFFIITGWDAQARPAFPPDSRVSAILSKPIGLEDIDRIVETLNLKRSRKHVSGRQPAVLTEGGKRPPD